ncbi:4877_t:CDS:2 [Acaulospora colombiana]|uniref:4877_t:CDS:1 n=1 Tax=Acaulospora colombiana TaxID=27376 RepID=A0ACA9KSE0_9GLOM|nr:4877_t:CDS:2 [Acaulospora colombiana]
MSLFAVSIQFGSVNQPSANPPLSSSPVQPSLVSGGNNPPPLPKSGTPTFGTVTVRSPSEELPASTPASSGSVTGAPKPLLATRINKEIPRTQSAPPLLNLQDSPNVGQPSGHQMNNMTPRNQQQLSAATPPQPISTSNPPHHRKDSASSTVSSNDATSYHQRSRDKSVPGAIPPSSHSNPQPIPQAQIPMTGPQPTIPVQMWPYNRSNEYYYPNYYPHMYVIQTRPTIPIPTHLPPTATSYTPMKNHAVPIVNPVNGSVVNAHPSSVYPGVRKEDVSVSTVVDAKRTEDVDKDKEQTLDNDKKESKAVPIVDPVDKDKIERERKENEEKEKKEREEKERKEREEKERLEREREAKEKERIEREERERKEREERERKEREEREREEREREEKERKEREEKERKEREERERKEREERERKEREEREREERERKEREERERKEREERERKEREERERKEREEREREEKERKEREEKERLEKERLEREKKERLEREERERLEREERERLEREAEQKEKEQLEAQEERKRIEREEALRKEETERQISEKKKKEVEEEEKKKEIDKDAKKEEKKYGKGHKPEALDLSRTISAPALGSGPLSSARIIDDLNSVQYPAHIKSPNPELNVNSDPGKFKYDRNFLMQFMEVCKEKPTNLPTLDAVGMEEPKDDKKGGSRPRPGSQRTSQHAKSGSGQSQYSQMGEFKLQKSDGFPVSSSYGSRTGFARSSLGPRTGSGSMSLPSSLGNPPSPVRAQSSIRRKKPIHQGQPGQNIGQESVTPLEISENRWIPMMHKTIDERLHLETVQRKVKALLNKLTLEKFDRISDQIIEFANRSREERDGCLLREVISLTFDKSCDEPNFSQMYAQLCRKMMEKVDPEIIDESVRNAENKPVQGGALFRKYLLNRCQENFEKGWKVNIPVPSNEKGEPDLMSDEYYTAAKAKRHGLGLIRFIGELFKLSMLTERIMHECIKKLLSNKNPEEEEMESLCKLLTTVGQQLDHANAKTHMDAYFSRMDEMSKNMKLSSRIRFMILDVIELRSNNWVPRRDNNAPKTIAEIHEDAAKQKEEAEYMRRTTSSGGRGLPKIADQMTRVGSGRRDKGSGSHGAGGQQAEAGWNMVGGGSSSASRKTGDLSKFGSVRSKVSGNVNLAPGGGAFGAKWKTDNKDRDDKSSVMARGNSASNTYSVLTNADPEIRKSSDGERKKLQLAPPSKSIHEDSIAPKSIMTKPSSVPLTVETANKKIDNMIEEYFTALDLRELIYCINELPKEYHSKAISEFANKVIEKKEDDVRKVVGVFKKLSTEGIISKSVFMEGLPFTMEFLTEISTDAPKSYTYVGQLLYGSSIELKEVAELLKPLFDIEDVKGVEKVMAGYLEEWKNVSVNI